MRKRTGRRPGSSNTSEAIRLAARSLFAQHGFDATTIRAIADEAKVDPALVHHYYGTKEKLFLAVVSASPDAGPGLSDVELPVLTTTDPQAASEELVRKVVTLWDSPAGFAGLALMKSAVNSEIAAKVLREFLATQVLRHALGPLGIPDHEFQTRASLLATQISGVMLMRHVLKFEPVASASVEQLVAAIAPHVRRFLFEDLSALGFGE